MMILKADSFKYILKSGIGRHYGYKLEYKKGKYVLSTIIGDRKFEVYYSSKMTRLKVTCTEKSGKPHYVIPGEGFECLVDKIESSVLYFVNQEEQSRVMQEGIADQTPEESAAKIQEFVDEYGEDVVRSVYEYGLKNGILTGDGDVAATFKRFQNHLCAKW